MIGAPELIVMMLFALVGAGVGAAIGARKSRIGFGLVLGLVLGPIGWLVVLVTPSNFPKCPECKGDVIPGARKCKNCGSNLAAAS